MDVRLPDGRIVKNVPAGTTKEQLLAKVNVFSPDQPIDLQAMQQRTREHRVMEARIASDPLSRDAQETSQEGKLPTWLGGNPGASYADKFTATPPMQFAIGAGAPFVGAGQLVASAIGQGQGINDAVQSGAEMQQRGGAGGFNPFNVAGQILSPANMMLARALGPATTAAGRVGQGAAMGGFAGATTPVTTPGDYWDQKGAQTVAGVAGGAAVPTAGILADFLMGKGSRALMQSAIKPSTTEPRAKVDRAITTMLEGGDGVLPGFNASRGGMERLQRLGTAANADADAAIAASSGATIPKVNPASRILQGIQDLESTNPLPSANRNAMEGVYDEFMSNPFVGQQIPVAKAQQYKQALYRSLEGKYGAASEGDEQARKLLAYGLRKDLETAVPGVVEPNARASELFNAKNVAQRYVNASGNNNPVGSFAPIAGAIHPVAGAATVLERNAVVRSMLARILNQGNRAVQPVARSKQAALAAAILANQSQEQP